MYRFELWCLPDLNTDGSCDDRTFIAAKNFRFDQLLKRSDAILSKDYDRIFS